MSDATRLGSPPEAGLPEERPERGWTGVALRLVVALLVLGGAYLGVALWFKDRPPAGVSVAGVDIGTMSREAARDHLERSLADRLAEPVVVTVRPEGGPPQEETQLNLDPRTAGLGHDLEATLDQVTGFTLDPRALWTHVVRSERELPLLGTVDRDALTAAVQEQAQDYDTDPVEGEVAVTEEAVEVVDAEDGRLLDVERTVDAVAGAWPDSHDVTGAAVTVAPVLTQAEIERFTREEVEPVLAAPLVVTATRGSGEDAQTAAAELAPREIAALLSVDSGAGATLALEVDEESLLARLREDLGQLEQGPVDATVRLESGSVEVVPSRTGAVLDEDTLLADVVAALGATGPAREVTTELQPVEPAIGTAAAEDWTFSEMGAFSSVFPTGEANSSRTANLVAAVRNLDGYVVMPGEQFALSTALGDITEANGYREAPIIVDGRLVQGMGGGLSQISTVVFNTSWFSGVQLDAHTPHSYYIPRYPAGREATLALPGLDNLWTNDTDNPVVVRARIGGDTIFMSFLGQRAHDVETVDGPRLNPTRGERIEDDDPECVPQNPSEGFTITNVRILRSGGAEVGRDEFTTTYQAADEIVCTHPDAGY
ncbi:VanW family protein [Ornithinimicrobium cerasi]|uniref:Vancomycin resistance protein YoaR, contains peptidoglycan-binding and VanW domains n=1 Tax=Ornithinimicrobium cerasi TaxID=2248773 RepID=A0A285VP68_9MICO|nr:VanW family protein [Ornithinimicrobium cerasi]SOC55697.1 Vancomycin resistance protein YoaR, contains peptidoglycan-binding and VanW domains [Ornithinimicrobium cerasi]